MTQDELTQKLRQLDELDLLTACLRGEVEGEPLMGKIAVACVIRNRVKDPRWPSTYPDVMLQPSQFSCFMPKYFRPEILEHPFHKTFYRECKYVAFGVMFDWISDVTGGANHYHARGVSPPWAGAMARTDVGESTKNHLFYKA